MSTFGPGLTIASFIVVVCSDDVLVMGNGEPQMMSCEARFLVAIILYLYIFLMESGPLSIIEKPRIMLACLHV